MRKKKTLKKHTVKANVQILDLTKAGSSIEFKIYASEKRIGRIVIGRGSLTWYGRSRKHGKTYSWSEFAEKMDELSYG
ncbi:MAG: hypothetical protein H0X14_03865 [Acidobacteria bacterium]|nr:hypothetical protein [Acidobacteriota bacterium]